MCALKVSVVKRRDGTLKIIIGLKLNHSVELSVYIQGNRSKVES